MFNLTSDSKIVPGRKGMGKYIHFFPLSLGFKGRKAFPLVVIYSFFYKYE